MSAEQSIVDISNVSTEALIQLSIDINTELRNREYQLPEPDEPDIQSLESQLLK